MTLEEHKQRHKELHKSLDELFADFIHHNSDIKTVTQIPVLRLIEWSYQQSINPTEE